MTECSRADLLIGRRQALRLLTSGGLLAMAGGLAACGGASPRSTEGGAAATDSVSGKPAPGTDSDYKTPATWDELLAAAKAEGKVVVTGTPNTATREKLPPAFTQRFGIQMEYLAGATEVTARLERERAAGLYTVDAGLNGTDSMYTTLYARKWVDAWKPALLLPDAADGSKWKTGAPWFRDPGGDTALQIFSSVSNNLTINADALSPTDFATAEALLDQAGVKFARVELPDAPNSVGGGFSIIGVMNRAPHPNAARVFANWMASKEGMTVYSQAQLEAPARSDIDPTWVSPDLIPKPGVKYLDAYDYAFATTTRHQIQAFFQNMLK